MTISMMMIMMMMIMMMMMMMMMMKGEMEGLLDLNAGNRLRLDCRNVTKEEEERGQCTGVNI